MISNFRNNHLGQQLAIITASLCLLVSLALITLAAISTRHTQMQMQEEYGSALARQIARQISSALESGDLLSVSASLQRFISISQADAVTVTDVEGKILGQAGERRGKTSFEYTAPVQIESDIAGQAVIFISGDQAKSLQMRLILSLLALAVLLSLAVFMICKLLGRQLGKRLLDLSRTIRLEDAEVPAGTGNEVDTLERHIHALPMDLLRTRSEPMPEDDNYRTTAVLYLQLESLVLYVDTLDQESLHRYIHRLHQVVFGSAGFYAGELHVARQFGLAIYFTGQNKAGSAAFRAASCAWLIQSVARELEKQMSLSLGMSMAICQSELSMGSSADIYPGLYMQHTLDELQSVCAAKPPNVLLSPVVCEDVDIAGRLQYRATDVRDYAVIEEFAGNYQDLLERQMHLLLKRLTDAGRIFMTAT